MGHGMEGEWVGHGMEGEWVGHGMEGEWVGHSILIEPIGGHRNGVVWSSPTSCIVLVTSMTYDETL